MFKVLIADDDSVTSRRLQEFLREKGFPTEHASGGKMLKEKILSFEPTFVICDLTLVEFNALNLLKWLKGPDFKGKAVPKVFVTSSHNVVQNIKECISQGAASYIIKPFTPEDILGRLVFQIQNRRSELNTAKEKTENVDAYFNLLEMAFKESLSGRDTHEIFFNLVKLVATTLKAVRCSIIRVSEDLQQGLVMCSSDDAKLKGLKININRYPEVLHVMQTQKTVVIEDLGSDPQMKEIQKMVSSIAFNSMIVVPVTRDVDSYGVLSARMEKDIKFSERDIKLVELISHVASLYVSSKSTLPHEWLKHFRPAQVEATPAQTPTAAPAADPTSGGTPPTGQAAA